MRIGPYEILGELGRGGKGVVYRVRTPRGDEAALKLFARSDRSKLAGFERETRLLASLGEALGFVGLLDSGSSASGAWLLMPLVPGGTLRKRLEAGPLGVEETVALGIRLASALGAAHERGIVHRDVKPENVLFTSDGRPLLADLGLAKHFDATAAGASQSVDLTVRGAFKGTGAYMAPEQMQDAANVGPPADVFALGAVLYECLAGRPAFAGENMLEVLGKVSSGVVEPIGRPDVPAPLAGIVARALARDPRMRFPDAGSLARALRGLESGRSLRVRRSYLLPIVVGAGLGLVVLILFIFPTRPHPVPPVTVPPASPARSLSVKDRSGDWEGEIAELTKLIELDPRYAMAWCDRGVARGRKGDLDGQIADGTKAIELDPGLALAWSNRGVARGQKGDSAGEIADETKAVELDPKLAWAWTYRGGERSNNGDLNGAIADLTRAIELDPGLGVAWHFRGVTRLKKGDSDGAIADETRAIELDSSNSTAWGNRGAARAAKGDLDGAIDDYTKGIELAPTLALTWVNRGKARFLKADVDGAIADWTKAIELDPMDFAARTDRAEARRNKGDLEGAIADLERYLELAPADRNTAEVRRRLADLKAKRAH